MTAAEPSPSERILDCAAVSAWLAERGIVSSARSKGQPISPAAIRRMASENRLPMWKSPTGALVITESALQRWVMKRQVEADNRCSAAATQRISAKARRR